MGSFREHAADRVRLCTAPTMGAVAGWSQFQIKLVQDLILRFRRAPCFLTNCGVQTGRPGGAEPILHFVFRRNCAKLEARFVFLQIRAKWQRTLIRVKKTLFVSSNRKNENKSHAVRWELFASMRQTGFVCAPLQQWAPLPVGHNSRLSSSRA